MAEFQIPLLRPFTARVAGRRVPRVGGRWLGGLAIEYRGARIHLLMPGSIARWIFPGELVKEEIVAIWRCPICGAYAESNIQPECPPGRGSNEATGDPGEPV